jgi:hypothetical protein
MTKLRSLRACGQDAGWKPAVRYGAEWSLKTQQTTAAFQAAFSVQAFAGLYRLKRRHAGWKPAVRYGATP